MVNMIVTFFTSFQFTTTTTLLTVRTTTNAICNSGGLGVLYSFTNNGGFVDLTELTILSAPGIIHL
jgi:hypothetical protein